MVGERVFGHNGAPGRRCLLAATAAACQPERMDVRSDRRHRLAADPETVWDVLSRLDDYQRWWPWLRTFEADALEAGQTWRCTIRPPVPYDLRLSVHLHRVERPYRIDATVGDDLTGAARLDLIPAGDHCDLRLRSTLSPRSGMLRAVAGWAPWIAQRGHDWVLDTGLRQFRDRAL